MVEDEFSLDALTTTLNNKSLYTDRTLFLTEVGNPCILTTSYRWTEMLTEWQTQKRFFPTFQWKIKFESDRVALKLKNKTWQSVKQFINQNHAWNTEPITCHYITLSILNLLWSFVRVLKFCSRSVFFPAFSFFSRLFFLTLFPTLFSTFSRLFSRLSVEGCWPWSGYCCGFSNRCGLILFLKRNTFLFCGTPKWPALSLCF